VNKKGFTLVELMAVMVVLVLVMMLIVPGLRNLRNANREKEYTTYLDMMVEYAKVVPNYKDKSCIYLSSLNMQEMAGNVTCTGYVNISNNTITPYLSCVGNKKNELLYKTAGYNYPSNCY